MPLSRGLGLSARGAAPLTSCCSPARTGSVDAERGAGGAVAGWAPGWATAGWAPAGCACTPGSRRGAVPGRSAARLPLPAAGPASARGVGRVARGLARGGDLAGSRRLPSQRRGAFNSVRAGAALRLRSPSGERRHSSFVKCFFPVG